MAVNIVGRSGYDSAVRMTIEQLFTDFIASDDVIDISYKVVRGRTYYILTKSNGCKRVVGFVDGVESLQPNYSSPWTPYSVYDIQFVDDGWYAVRSGTGATSGQLYRWRYGVDSSWVMICDQYIYPGGNQRFSGFPDSPFTKTAYPSQIIIQTSTYTGTYPTYQLLVTTWGGTNPFACNEVNLGGGIWAVATTYVYNKVGNSWVYAFTRYNGQYIWLRGPLIDRPLLGLEGYIVACNCNLTWLRDGQTITKIKTTTPTEDNLPGSPAYFGQCDIFKSSRGSLMTVAYGSLFEYSWSGSKWTRYDSEDYNYNLRTINFTPIQGNTQVFGLDYWGSRILYALSSPAVGQLVRTSLGRFYGQAHKEGIRSYTQHLYVDGVEQTEEPPEETDPASVVISMKVYEEIEEELLGESFTTCLPPIGERQGVNPQLLSDIGLVTIIPLDWAFDIYSVSFGTMPQNGNSFSLLGSVHQADKLLPSPKTGLDNLDEQCFYVFNRSDSSIHRVTFTPIEAVSGRVNL